MTRLALLQVLQGLHQEDHVASYADLSHSKVAAATSIFVNINVQTMANKVFQGSNAAMAIIDVVGDVSDDLTSELASLDNVIQVQITARDE